MERVDSLRDGARTVHPGDDPLSGRTPLPAPRLGAAQAFGWEKTSVHPDDLNGEVGAKAHGPKAAIDQAVQGKPAELPSGLSHPQGVVAPIGKQLYRSLQRRRLFGRGLKGATEGEGLHKCSTTYHAKEVGGYSRLTAACRSPAPDPSRMKKARGKPLAFAIGGGFT